MFASLLLISVGVIILSLSGRIITRALLALAERLRVSPFLVALFLVAFSTSIPEFSVAVSSALAHKPSISLGDVFGSNIANLTLIAGLVSLISRKTIALEHEVTKWQRIWIFAVGSLPVLLLLDGTLSRQDGMILLAAFGTYVWRLMKDKRAVMTEAQKIAEPPDKNFITRFWKRLLAQKDLFKHLALFAFGVLLLLVASRMVLSSALSLASGLGVAPFLIGLFLVAIGTSLPELAFGIRSSLAGKPELSIGDLLGSAAVNSSLILGVAALIFPITPIALSSALFSGIFMIAVFAVFYLLIDRGGVLRPQDGGVLLVLYALFLLVLLHLTGIS